MFQNMLMTALTPLGNTSEVHQWENRPFTAVWPEQQVEETKSVEVTRVVRRKPKRLRTAYTTEQLKVLEKTYTRFKYIDVERRRDLAASLNIGEKSIKVWFQNRRMKEKRESSESSCDSSTEVCTEVSFKPVNDNLNASEKINNDLEPQYKLPVFHVQAYPHQFYGQSRLPPPQYKDNNLNQNSVTSTSQSGAFFNESGVYPTQYYPSSSDYYPGGNYEYDNNTANLDYWSPNGFDLSYFQCNY